MSGVQHPCGWMRTDIDFGVPWKRFRVSHREVVLRRVHRVLFNYSKDANEGDKLAAELIGIVAECRPDLKDALLFGIHQPHGMAFILDVSHPSFPRVLMGSIPLEESLETCPVCHTPLPLDGKLWAWEDKKGVGMDRVKTVCSEACSKSPPVGPSVAEKCATGRQRLGAEEQAGKSFTLQAAVSDATRTRLRAWEDIDGAVRRMQERVESAILNPPAPTDSPVDAEMWTARTLEAVPGGDWNVTPVVFEATPFEGQTDFEKEWDRVHLGLDACEDMTAFEKSWGRVRVTLLAGQKEILLHRGYSDEDLKRLEEMLSSSATSQEEGCQPDAVVTDGGVR